MRLRSLCERKGYKAYMAYKPYRAYRAKCLCGCKDTILFWRIRAFSTENKRLFGARAEKESNLFVMLTNFR